MTTIAARAPLTPTKADQRGVGGGASVGVGAAVGVAASTATALLIGRGVPASEMALGIGLLAPAGLLAGGGAGAVVAALRGDTNPVPVGIGAAIGGAVAVTIGAATKWGGPGPAGEKLAAGIAIAAIGTLTGGLLGYATNALLGTPHSST